MMSGYSRCPIGTVEAFDDGWLKTGDYGYVKANKIYIKGRIKVGVSRVSRFSMAFGG
jgi:long-subunit acyl-CoA synthetase (AMP-forming)